MHWAHIHVWFAFGSDNYPECVLTPMEVASQGSVMGNDKNICANQERNRRNREEIVEEDEHMGVRNLSHV